MTWSFGPLALVVAAAVLVVLGLLYSETLRTKLYPPDKFWPYYARKVLNPPELALYQRLRDALPERLILAQVPLSRVLGVRETTYADNWRHRIAGEHLDFVVCSPDATVLAAVALENSSSPRTPHAGTAPFTENALAAAGIALLRWDAAALPSEAELRRLVEQASARQAAARPV